MLIAVQCVPFLTCGRICPFSHHISPLLPSPTSPEFSGADLANMMTIRSTMMPWQRIKCFAKLCVTSKSDIKIHPFFPPKFTLCEKSVPFYFSLVTLQRLQSCQSNGLTQSRDPHRSWEQDSCYQPTKRNPSSCGQYKHNPHRLYPAYHHHHHHYHWHLTLLLLGHYRNLSKR